MAKVNEYEMARDIASILITEMELVGLEPTSYDDRLKLEKTCRSMLASLDSAGYYFGKRKGTA